jgi:hypothetical protein
VWKIRLIFSKLDIVVSGGSKKRTKSDDGWLTAINETFYRPKLVGFISAKYRSHAK